MPQPSTRRLISESTFAAQVASTNEDIKSLDQYVTPETGVSFPFITKLLTDNVGVLVLGDSKIEGAGVQTTRQRSQNRLVDALRLATGMSGSGWDMGRGYIPSAYTTFWGFTDAPVLTNADSLTSTGGLGGRLVEVKLTNGVIDFGNLDFGTATSFDVAYCKSPYTSSVDVLVDNAVVTNINTNDTTITFGNLSTVALATGGVHNIKIRQKGSASSYVEGIVHRTANKGIVLYDSSRSGAQVDYYLPPGNGQPAYIWQSNVGVAKNVGLIVMAFGTNDMTYATAANWESNIRALINKCAVHYPGVGIVFLMAAELLEDASTNNTKHADFTQRAQNVCDDFENVILLKESDWFEPKATAPQDPQGWLFDAVHYGKEASWILGRAMAKAVF